MNLTPSLSPANPIEQRLASLRQRVEVTLANALPAAQTHPAKLHQAMRYAVFNGGKRMRPLLTYAAGQALTLAPPALDSAACAIELIHAYSLVHDDLPAMDDDDLRRGQASCHRAFDEATAILAGDGLQALAFQVIAEHAEHSSEVRLRLSRHLACACGSRGMAGGQAIDLAAVGDTLDGSQLEAMHRLKTGALIEYAAVAPALCAPTTDARHLEALKEYGGAVGLAFQIQDDILDVEGDPSVIGKAQGADAGHNKPTYPACLGLDRSKALAQDCMQRALDQLDGLHGDCELLDYLARFAVSRQR